MKILLIDDDHTLMLHLTDLFLSNGYLIDGAETGADAKFRLMTTRYDLVILDWELPDSSGPELCRAIRQSRSALAPVLFLTGRASIEDKLVGFNSGADDYLVKPFHNQELLARLKALLKRPPVIVARQLMVRDIVLDLDSHKVYRDGKQIELFPKEFALLEFFMSHPNRIYSADDLLERLWSTDSESNVETVRVTLMRIRQKLQIEGDKPLIVTLRNIGYRLEP